MSTVAEPAADSQTRRSLGRQVMHLVRRAHLYLGLFLLPCAVLYGVTAFLFNHPTAFSDQPTATFGRSATAGTPLENLPAPAEQAAVVVARLNERLKPDQPLILTDPTRAGYNREFAFATVKADGKTVSVLFDVKTGGGTVRMATDSPPPPPVEKAPFAVGSPAPRSPQGKGRKQAADTRPADDGLFLDQPLHERVKAAVPTVLERTGFPAGDVTVTSVPDLTFPVTAGGKTWTATYNPMTGGVSGQPADAVAAPEMTARRFLLRLHTAHGYPGEPNARWAWAVLVDATAGVLCFWGVSGLFMWWRS
ncbi:MAG: hypothetical protein U0871_28850 [Gemmataceae bacterium]